MKRCPSCGVVSDNFAPCRLRTRKGSCNECRRVEQKDRRDRRSSYERTMNCQRCGKPLGERRRDTRTCSSVCHSNIKYHKDKEKYRAIQNRHKYGIEPEEYERLAESQMRRCAICFKSEEDNATGRIFLHIDHDHVTGKIRGLLCSNCNRAIGMLGEDYSTIMSAAIYVFRGGIKCRI